MSTNSLATQPFSTQALPAASRLLVITGDTQFAGMVSIAISVTDMQCVLADSMARGAKMLQTGLRPAAILVDLSSSYAVKFVRDIKSHAQLSKIPLIVVTHDPSLPEVTEAIKAGANRWLMKSFAETTLVGVIRQLSSL